MAETANQTPLFIGRAILAIGDPTTALGAGMTAFEDEFPTVEITHTERRASGSDRVGNQLASAAYLKPAGVRVVVTGYKNQAAALAAMLGSITVNGEGYDVATQTSKYDPPTLAVIPVAEKEGAIDSGGVFWFPAVQAEGDLSFLFDDTQEGDDANATFQVTLVGLKREKDQDGEDLPEGSRLYFRGSPNERGDLAWSLPEEFDAPGD